MKAVRSGNTYYVESRNRKGAAYVPTETDVWHRHANMRITKWIENEHLVVMKTTVGDIELELWTKETPKACGNFMQLCTGEGGKIYGEPFKDKFYSRLRFFQRDLIAMAKLEKMTMVSNSSLLLVIYQICRINIQSLVKLLEKLYITCLNLKNHLWMRDYNLLSFGDEAEEDEEESVILNTKFRNKGKSARDHLIDPKSSSQPAVEPSGLANKKRKGRKWQLGK
ncbi:Peptidyl-prolyl cis-trans isomerase CWC27 like protein [Eufriesea mexicana]|uniref:Spliceosome-associated protein CWC27 homolog n=1 Tax=Eufriesea mexicana TaxID=516756 RepID=A0A310SEE2_9HYME|nr:Peptidyl-prolyl cis-trans isomerase CWC27 like protein [Eufriesea mexicana]